LRRLQGPGLVWHFRLPGKPPVPRSAGILDAYKRPAFDQIHVPRSELYPIGGAQEDDDRSLFVMVKASFPSKSRVLWLTDYGVERFPSFSEFFVTMIAENFDEMEKLQEE
jgi:hypothetical protein